MPFTHLNSTERILEKRSIPAGGLQRPGTNVDATVNYDRPHTDEAVIGSGAGPNTQDLALVDGGHERPRQAAGCSSSSNGPSSHHGLLRSWCSCLRGGTRRTAALAIAGSPEARYHSAGDTQPAGRNDRRRARPRASSGPVACSCRRRVRRRARVRSPASRSASRGRRM